jgi:uncharacterized protein (TIGR02145 family)
MNYKYIFKAVAVSAVAAFFSIGCGGDDGGGGGNPVTPDNGGGSGGTVKIGGKTWMAKNLNIATANSQCYDNDPANCAKYGRLYTWDDAMSACPSGWHLPSDADWTALTDAAGGESVAGTKLKSKSGWDFNGNGTDEYGFSALPGGVGLRSGSTVMAGNVGYWWSSTESSADHAWIRSMAFSDKYVDKDNSIKTMLYSVRCVQD